MDFLNPAVFLFSSTLVGLAILLLLVVSRPGLPVDQPALRWWIAYEVVMTSHRFALLLQPGLLLPPQARQWLKLDALAFHSIDTALLLLALGLGVKALCLLCNTALGRTATAALLLLPAAGSVMAINVFPAAKGQSCVFIISALLCAFQVGIARPSLSSGSRGLKILTAANSLIMVMLLAGAVALLLLAPAPPAAPPGIFLPHSAGIFSDLVASVTRSFAVSLLLQERQQVQITLLSTTDALTGVLNRRGALPLMEQALRLAERQGTALSLAVIDIDHFKRVNDTLGHDAGDAVLRAVAQMLRDRSRRSDTLARWGGEEFVLVLPHCDLASALAKLDELRSDLPAALVGQAPCSVTFSAGLASWQPGQGRAELHALIAHADRCLYAAKRSRNCVVADPAPLELAQAQP